MAKLDPRADPLSDPPAAKDDFSVDRVAAPVQKPDEPKVSPPKPALPKATPTKLGMPAIEPPVTASAKAEDEQNAEGATSSVVPAGTAEKAKDEAAKDEAVKVEAKADTAKADTTSDAKIEVTPPAKAAPKITSQDPRYEPLEKLLDLNDWKKIGVELGPMAEIGKLPPNLGLVAALAHNENAKDGEPEAVVSAIRCMAGLLGVAEDSPIARVLARRMLRKNPVRFTERQAPAARTSMLIVLATLVVGGGVGWLASIGSWRGILALLHR